MKHIDKKYIETYGPPAEYPGWLRYALIEFEKPIMKLGTLLYDNLQTEYLDKYHSFITENSLTVKITREENARAQERPKGQQLYLLRWWIDRGGAVSNTEIISKPTTRTIQRLKV